jgi:hypothetical protein
MSSLEYFFYLAGESLDVVGYCGIVTIPLFLGALFLVISALCRRAVSVWRILVACMTPAVIPMGVLIVGVAFRFREGVHEPVPRFAGESVDCGKTALAIIMLMMVPLSVGLCWWARRELPAVVAATLWWASVAFCASFMASMSITGTWL